MPVPTENPGQPTARADGATVVIQMPVRCETRQRQAAMTSREAYALAGQLMAAAHDAAKYEKKRAAESN